MECGGREEEVEAVERRDERLERAGEEVDVGRVG